MEHRPDDLPFTPDDAPPDLILATPTVGEIILTVADFYGVSIDDIRATGQRPPIAFARHVICYFARTMTRASNGQIAQRLGGFNNTLPFYGLDRIRRLREQTEIIRDDLDILRMRIVDRAMRRSEGRTWH